MFDKVFISYAKEDFEFAEKLYAFLTENGFNPWLDKKSLLPGQQWDYEIKKGLREANYVILLLSENSVQKRGYVQREFKIALKYYEEKLEDDIYLIPIKINKCNVPESLSSFQWIEIVNNSFDSILQSLSAQQNKYLEFHQQQLNRHRTFETKEITEEFFYKKKSLNLKIQTSYFQFVDSENQSLNELNNSIAGHSINGILDSRGYILGETHDILERSEMDEMCNWFFDSSYLIHFLNASIVSITENIYTYTGGAHGAAAITGHNYYISPAYKLKLENLFYYKDYQTVLEFISNFCFNELQDIYNDGANITQEEIANQDKSIFWENSLDPLWENFNNFIINREYISIIFNQYQVSSYVFGIQVIDIPIAKFMNLKIDINFLLEITEKLK